MAKVLGGKVSKDLQSAVQESQDIVKQLVQLKESIEQVKMSGN